MARCMWPKADANPGPLVHKDGRSSRASGFILRHTLSNRIRRDTHWLVSTRVAVRWVTPVGN